LSVYRSRPEAIGRQQDTAFDAPFARGDDRACSCIAPGAEFLGGLRASGCLTCFGQRLASIRIGATLIDVRHLSKIPVLELIHRKLPAMLLISQEPS
jgi:hypothetical protein